MARVKFHRIGLTRVSSSWFLVCSFDWIKTRNWKLATRNPLFTLPPAARSPVAAPPLQASA